MVLCFVNERDNTSEDSIKMAQRQMQSGLITRRSTNHFTSRYLEQEIKCLCTRNQKGLHNENGCRVTANKETAMTQR